MFLIVTKTLNFSCLVDICNILFRKSISISYLVLQIKLYSIKRFHTDKKMNKGITFNKIKYVLNNFNVFLTIKENSSSSKEKVFMSFLVFHLCCRIYIENVITTTTLILLYNNFDHMLHAGLLLTFGSNNSSC